MEKSVREGLGILIPVLIIFASKTPHRSKRYKIPKRKLGWVLSYTLPMELI